MPSGGFFDPDKLQSEISELNDQVNNPNLWDNPDAARALLQKKSGLEKTLNELLTLESEYKNLAELYEMAPDDGEIVDAFLFIQAGAGGTEAQDWAQMMSRMYARWAERHGFSIEVIEEHEGDTAGIKNITYRISGDRAYGWLKNEIGVHRLVRISPFNANGKRQTSFASVESMTKTCVSTRTVHRAPAASTSTKPTVPCASRICQPTPWSHAKMNGPRFRTAKWR